MLSADALARLRRAAVHAEKRGAPEEWTRALRAAAEGDRTVPDPGWIDGLIRAIRKLSSQAKRLVPWHEELRSDDLRDRAA